MKASQCWLCNTRHIHSACHLQWLQHLQSDFEHLHKTPAAQLEWGAKTEDLPQDQAQPFQEAASQSHLYMMQAAQRATPCSGRMAAWTPGNEQWQVMHIMIGNCSRAHRSGDGVIQRGFYLSLVACFVLLPYLVCTVKCTTRL